MLLGGGGVGSNANTGGLTAWVRCLDLGLEWCGKGQWSGGVVCGGGGGGAVGDMGGVLVGGSTKFVK